MEINRVTADVGAVDRSDGAGLSNIPHFDVVVPTSGNDEIWILLVELDAEDTIGMSWLSGTASFEAHFELASLLVVHSHDGVGSSGSEHRSVWVVVNCQELVQLIVNRMQQLTRSGVPVLQGSVGVHRNDHVLGHCLASCGPPPELRGGHGLLHLGVHDIRLLTGESVINSNCAVITALGNVLVIWVKPDAEGLVL